MSEELIPIYVAAGGVSNIPDAAISSQRNLFEVVVISGGPLFGWFGRQLVADANKATHGNLPGNIDFDFAGSAYHSCCFEVGEIGAFTIFSDNETIGYIRVKELST